jgi:hypothetical protein
MARRGKTTYEAPRRGLTARLVHAAMSVSNRAWLERRLRGRPRIARRAEAIDEMKAAKTRMRSALGHRKILVSAGALAALAASIVTFGGDTALAQNAGECARLQQAIAAHRGSSGSQAAVERQRAELGRTRAYAGSLGCGNRKFLMFGSDPPPQCGEVNAQISRMEANLADLQARAGGGAGDLVARYNAECLHAPSGPGNVFAALFGGLARLAAPQDQEPQTDARFEDRGEAPRNEQPGQPGEKGGGVQAHAGSYAVCVRTCDGSFFPVSYSGAGSRADSLEDVCRALCPNADMALYSFPFGGTIEEAEAPSGEPYANLPNASKFEKAFDPSCSCRRKGQSWADALADAEARYGHQKHDILVTPEKSAEMARPIIDPKAKPTPDTKVKPAAPNASVVAGPSAAPAPGLSATPGVPSSDTAITPVLDANGADTKLSAEAATVSRETSGIAGDGVQSAKSFSVNQGRTVEVTGPDGVKRPVRIVGPAL